MIKAPTVNRARKAAFAAVIATLLLPPALARAEGGEADTSAWDRGAHSAVRLLSGKTGGATPEILAAIEIALDPGWKTYWRYPGDSGVPPRFDLSASDNVADVHPLFPAPRRFKDGNGTSIGYGERVVIPLKIIPKDATKPVTLRAKIDYAICEKLCVPVEAKTMLRLTNASPATKSSINEGLKRVPHASSIGAGGTLAIASASVTEGARPRVVVDVVVPPGRKADLFAEGPTTDWNLPLPEPVDGAPPGRQRFSFELDGLPSGATAKGATITFTATADNDAVQASLTVD